MDVSPVAGWSVVGVDFTSRPTPRKPITVARGVCRDGAVQLQELLTLPSDAAFAAWLAGPGPWVGAFDFPFGLPRELVEHLGWPREWRALMEHYARLDRATIRATFAAFCAARPAGGKFAHRVCDMPAGSSPSMKWVNPPVAYMMHAGIPLLLEAGLELPGHCRGDPERVALEAYPGLLARELIGNRSYKSDELAKQTPARESARNDLLEALARGRTRLGLRLVLEPAQRDALVADATADRLDAVLCLVQAAWACGQPRYGVPEGVDPVEGWIVSAPC